MLALTLLEGLMAVLFIITTVLLILIVLLQKGRGGGLGAAFSGSGGSAFGTRTGDVFTWVTIVLTAAFLLLAVGTTLVFRPPPGLVTQPRFEPLPPGNIGEETPVKLYCDTLGAAIYYTVDGTDPISGKSDLYEGQTLKIQPGQTLKAIGSRPNWNPSVIQDGGGAYGVEDEEPVDVSPEDFLPRGDESTTLPAEVPAAPASE